MSSDDIIINAPATSDDVESNSKYAPSTSTTPSLPPPPPVPIIKNNDTNPNRLAPYNPTHSTAQSSALSLLGLTHNDTFFDLGCGDGRLIIAALEKCYNDDYLMNLHQEQQQLELEEEVKQLLLHNQIKRVKQKQQSLSPIRKTTPQHRRKKSVGWTSDNNNNNITTPALTETVRPQLHHARSYSTDASCSVPHLMRTASQEEDDDMSDSARLSIDEENADVPSAPSAQVEKGGGEYTNQELMTPTPQTPITPKICNRVKSTLTETTTHTDIDTSNVPQLPHANTSHDELDDTAVTPNTNNVNEQGIPKTISTPQPSPNNNDGHHNNHPNNTHHAPQISELPTGLSLCNEDMAQQILLSLPDDDIRQVVGIAQAQGGLLRQHNNNKEEGQSNYHPLSAGGGNGGILLNAGEATMINTTIPQTQTITTTQTQLQVTTPTRKGLQCVGIEYNQALAESAQTQFKQSHLYPHVREKVCIRWGDVLDEWNRVAAATTTAADVDDADAVDENESSALNNDCQGDDDKQQGIDEHEHEQDGYCSNEANKLTLLNDATAVFVYLLPKGLKKVKPLLYEAARRRHEDQKKEKQKQLEEQEWKDDQEEEEEEEEVVQEEHPLHRHPLQQPQNVHCKKPSHISDITDATDFIIQRSASPRNLQSAGSGIQLLQHHHKGVSHISDITDVDFITRNNSSRKSVSRRHISDITDVDFITSSRTTSLGRIVDRANDYDGGGLDDYVEQAAGLDRIVPTTAVATTMPNGDDDGNNSMIPSFRVVSYMFSIPGWKPTTVDRSSKGSCPLYLYENIHEMEVAEGE